jgi:hypothetical protein
VAENFDRVQRDLHENRGVILRAVEREAGLEITVVESNMDKGGAKS